MMRKRVSRLPVAALPCSLCVVYEDCDQWKNYSKAAVGKGAESAY